MATYHAKDAMVYISTSGTGAASELLGCTEWTLDMSTDTVEVTAFGDANKTYVQGLPDLSGTINGYWRDDEDKWFTAASSTDGIKIYLYFSRNATTQYAYGTAWFSISMSNSVTSACEMSANFIARGAWKLQIT